MRGKNIIGIFLLSGVLFLASVLQGQGKEEDQLDSLLKRMESRVASTQTVQCNFKQQRFLAIFSRPVTFQGRMVLSRPDKLRWENFSPIPSAMIFSGDNGLRCNDKSDPAHFDLKSDPVMKMVSEQIWTWADSAYKKLENQYEITLIPPSLLRMQPRDQKMKGIIHSIEVRFNPDTLQPEQITINEPRGDRTELSFFDYRLNSPVADALFSSCFP